MNIFSVVLGIFFLLTVAGAGDAASFDCKKATSKVEKIICSDDELSRLDESLNKRYLRALKRPAMKEQTIESQRQWLKNERNACQDAECIKNAYQTRIKELRDAVGAVEYVLVMSKDDCVCQHMLKIYNDDLREYGEIKYDQHDEFKAIKWEKQESYREALYKSSVLKKHDTLISKFDINNDGSPEIIIKDEHRNLRLMDSDAIYIFREKDFADFKDKIVINENFAKRAIGAWGWGAFGDETPFRGNGYELHELPAYKVQTTPTTPEKQFKYLYSLAGWFYFYPFIYQGKYFTSMHDWQPDVGKSWDTEYENYVKKKWEVILLFTPENQLKDVCYLLKVSDCKDKKGD
jgi:uncharacterized protein YecT (DUF1311 family)